MDGFGAITWWGFSPALDLQDKDVNTSLQELHLDEGSDTLNILLLGAGDCRHILKTVAKSYKYTGKKLNFYVLETNLELYARDMLFLSLVHENQQRMGLQEKAEYFLELFGNSLVRSQALEYVEKMSNMFIKCVTDFDYLEKTTPMFDLSLLKFKERDMMEGIFKFWRTPIIDVSTFDIAKAWELRLRQYLGVRYDAIPNVFDWDYNMKLIEKDAGIINGKFYSQWRHKGFAFEIREGTYDRPNKTLASGMVFKHEGERLARRGYWGDIIVSPYITLGIECEEQKFFKKSNNLYMNSSQQIAEYNLLQMCHEIATHTEYIAPKPEEKKEPKKEESATLTEITEEEEEQEEESVTQNGETTEGTDRQEGKEEQQQHINPLDTPYTPLDCSSVKVFFLPLNSSQELYKKSRYQQLFNIVYVSNSLVHLLTEDLSKSFADKSSVILETSKFMLELKDEQNAEFVKKITQIAEGVGCKPVGECEKKDAFAKFVFNRKSAS